MSEFHARYRAEPAEAPAARRAIVTFATACGFTRSDLQAIETAAGEAVANAIEHGNRERGFFDVTARRDERALVIEIRDRGEGFAFEATRPPGGSRPAARGWGIFLMRSLMDAVTYTEDGRTVRLEKRLPAAAEGGADVTSRRDC